MSEFFFHFSGEWGGGEPLPPLDIPLDLCILKNNETGNLIITINKFHVYLVNSLTS